MEIERYSTYNSESDPSSTVAVRSRRVIYIAQPRIQIRTRAEDAAVAGHDDGFDAWIGGERVECVLESRDCEHSGLKASRGKLEIG